MFISLFLLAVLGFTPFFAQPAYGQLGSANSWSIEEDLRIGRLDEPDYALNSITDLAIGPNGSIYVGQYLDRSVRVFDSSGTYAKRIGREGAGPGEFRDIRSLTWRGDSLGVRDILLSRLSFFDTAGNFLHSVSFREPMPGGSYSTLTPGTPMADGSLALLPSAPGRLLADGTIADLPLLLTSRHGEVQTILTHLSVDHDVARINFESGGTLGPEPFSDAPIWRAAADGESVWIIDRSVATDADEGYFRLMRLGLSGDTLASLRYRYTPSPMPSVLVDSVIDLHVRRISNGPARGAPPRVVEGWVRDAFFLPEFRVPVTEAVAGKDGLLWVRREEHTGLTVIWNVFSEDGMLLAMVRTPADLEVMATSDEYVWGVRQDELDVPYIYRYRIIRR